MPNLTPSAIVKNPSKFIDFEKILGKEPVIKTKKDFVDAVLSIPPDKENMIPDDVAEWLENETQTDISISEPKTTTSSKGVRKKWDGAGEPFRAGSKYLEVFNILKAGTHSRSDLGKEFTNKYGEKTGNAGNISTYIGNTMKVVSDHFDLQTVDSKLKLIPKK